MAASGRFANVRSLSGRLADPVTERDRELRRIAALCAPFFVLATVAGIYPLLEVTRMSVSEELYSTVGFTLAAFETLATDPYYHRVAFNTLWFAVATTLASVAVAVPVAHALEKYALPRENLLVTLVSFPISLPGIVAAFMILVLFGKVGIVSEFLAILSGGDPRQIAFATTVQGLFLAFCYSMIPRSTLLLRGAYAEVDGRAEEAAQSLGASPFETFRYVTLPQIRPGITGALILTFRTAIAIFGTLIVIQSLVVWTLQISREIGAGGGGNFRLASAMGVAFFVFTFAFTAIALRYTSAEVGI